MMNALEVCLKSGLYLAVMCCVFVHPASAQQKYFRITDGGKYYFFNNATIEQNRIINGGNNYTRAITPRTFFLEARNANLFPESITFTDFERMTIAQKQRLLDSLQQDFDWSKYMVSEEDTKEEKPVPVIPVDTVKPDFATDTFYSVQHLTFDKETSTLAGDLVSRAGRMQQFMLYPVSSKNGNGNVRWVIEWVEPELFLKKKGYRNLDLPEQTVYRALRDKGIDVSVLNSLIE